MKRLINIFSLLVILLFGLSSCDDFGNLNEDPTKSTNMDPNLLLPNLQLSLTNDYQEWHRHFMYPGGWVQQWCGDWGTTEYGCLAIKKDRKSTRLNSSHANISYAVFCLKKKKI